MKHEFIFLGKIKDRFIAEGVQHYLDRLRHYTPFHVTTLKEGRKKGKGKAMMEAEGQLQLQAVPQGAKIVVLDSRGTQFSSEGFAEKICQWELQGVRQLCYLIGGPEGHGAEVKRAADLLLSFSQMTFTHDMVRLLLVEQIYRAYTIKAGEKYHK